MTRACRAIVCMLLLLLFNIGVIYLAVTTLLPTLTTPPTFISSFKYKRISKSEIQQSLVIVSDMTSHFGRDAAFKLADMGFYVLAGVKTESERKAYSGYNTIKGKVNTHILNMFCIHCVHVCIYIYKCYLCKQK